MAYSAVGSFGTSPPLPPCPGDMAPNDDGTCPLPPDAHPCVEGSGRTPVWSFANDQAGNPTKEVVLRCGCPVGTATNPADPDGSCVPRVCGDFDLANSEPCVDDTGTYPDKWSYTAGGRKNICATSPYDLLSLHPGGTNFVDVAKRQRQRSQQRYYADLNCKRWNIGDKIMLGAGVVFAGVLVGGLIGS